MKSSFQYATILALATAGVSGLNNFFTKIAVTVIKDPIVYTTLKNALVALCIVGIIVIMKKWNEIASLTKRQFLKLFAIGIVGGSLPFALYFVGLTQTSAINAGLIHKTLFLWVALLAIPILKERITPLQWIGIGMIFAANLVVGGFNSFKYNTGELMILAATILWAIEAVIAKIALRDISSIVVAAARMTLGSAILGGIIAWRGGGVSVYNLTSEQWGWTVLTSALLLSYVLTWYTALKYAPATYVATLLVPATLITNVLSALFITHAFPAQQFISAILFIGGVLLVIYFAKKTAQNAVLENTVPTYPL